MEDTEAAAQVGFEKTLTEWSETGAKIAVIRDTPFPGSTVGNVPDCVASNSDNPSACEGKSAEWIPMDPQVKAVQYLAQPNLVQIDMNDQLCKNETCYPVVGGVMAYWDHSHVGATYVSMLSETLDHRLRRALNSEELF